MVSAQTSREKYEFADGLRAVAALMVALYHTYVYTGMTGQSSTLPAPFKILLLGDFAVPIFIVLSGFVLAIPVVSSPVMQLRGGFGKYIYRRARRILPPYYASLILFGILILCVPVMQHPSGTAWDSKVPVTLGGVVSHVLVIHNLSPEWIYQINGPAWSIATEWQLYFLLPLLILPLWRKLGPAVTVVVCVVIGCGIHFVAPSLDGAHFWFLGLFAMGVAAAYVVMNGPRIRLLGLILAIAIPALFTALVIFYGTAQEQAWITETVLGAVVAAALVWLAQRQRASKQTIVHRILQSRLLVWGGLWSYSAYLIHSPLLALGNFLLIPLGLPLLVHFVLMLCVVLPASLAIGFAFHLAVERRFMTTHQGKVASSRKLTV